MVDIQIGLDSVRFRFSFALDSVGFGIQSLDSVLFDSVLLSNQFTFNSVFFVWIRSAFDLVCFQFGSALN